MLFSDHLAFHLLQLPHRSKLSSSQATGYDAQVERWARFFTARSATEFEQLAAETEIMSLAKHTLEQLSQDPEARRLVREREDAIKLYEDELAVTRAQAEAQGRRKGLRKGLRQGRAETLLKLLGLRFGRLSAATTSRVARATIEQLDAWTERVLTAKTLDEVFSRKR